MADADEDRAEQHDGMNSRAAAGTRPIPISSTSGTPSSGASAIQIGPRFSVKASSNTPPTAPMRPPIERNVGRFDALDAERFEEHDAVSWPCR